jgi:uncharacterized protein (TIGR02391 family)
MNPKQQRDAIAFLSEQRGAALETFFRSKGLGGAYAAKSGSSREQRVNDALAAADKRSLSVDGLLREALDYFGHERPARRDLPEVSKMPAIDADSEPGAVQSLRETRPARRGGGQADSLDEVGAFFARIEPTIASVAEPLFRDGHRAAAIFEAFKAVEMRARARGGPTVASLDGKPLMARVFDREAPLLKINRGVSRSDRSEQEGFMLIYMGAMLGIRNPKAHDTTPDPPMDAAFEYVALASLLMRRLEGAQRTRRRRSPVAGSGQ